MANQMRLANSTHARLEVQFRFQRTRPRHGTFELAADFRLDPGITILFGPSGAGKSTLLDCIAGLLRPVAARIVLNGETLHNAATNTFVPPQRRHLAYLFQEPTLFPHLTVEQNVAFGLQDLGPADRVDRARDLLTAFRVQRIAHRKPAEISGGEAQRVALARALAASPRAVLLDEPLKGLDAELKSAIVDDLRAFNKVHQLPILYVTHQRDEVDALGERVIAIDRGQLIAEGAPHAVLDAPRKKRIAYAAGFENHLSSVVQDIREPDGVMRIRLAGSETELEVPLGYAAVGDRVHIAVRAGDILVATCRPEGLSARNILEGTLASLETNGTKVVCRVNAGAVFLVHVTPGAARSLELASGQRVWLVIKTHSCHLVED